MGFYQKYELLDLAKDDGIKTFVAKEKSTDRYVMVHLFPDGAGADARSLLGNIGRLPPKQQEQLYDWGDNDGTPFVVSAYHGERNIRTLLALPMAEPIGRRDRSPNWPAEYAEVRKSFVTPDRNPPPENRDRPSASGADLTTLLGTPAPKKPKPSADATQVLPSGNYSVPPTPEYNPHATQRLDLPELGLRSQITQQTPAYKPAGPSPLDQTVAMPRPSDLPTPPPPAAGPADFTRMMQVTAPQPVVPPSSEFTPPPPSAHAPLPPLPSREAPAPARKSASLLPVIIGLGAVCALLIIAILFVLFMKKH